MKLISKADVKVCRIRHAGSTHYFISPSEMRYVMGSIGEAAYYLYSYYRTGFFNESDDFDDSVVANVIGWPSHKVKKYRLIMESAAIFRKVRFGTKQEGITKVFVGADVVALYDAGLPADILDGKAFNKLKREFGIEGTEDLIARVSDMVDAYARDPSRYK